MTRSPITNECEKKSTYKATFDLAASAHFVGVQRDGTQIWGNHPIRDQPATGYFRRAGNFKWDSRTLPHNDAEVQTMKRFNSLALQNEEPLNQQSPNLPPPQIAILLSQKQRNPLRSGGGLP